jgi:hypothetical protein
LLEDELGEESLECEGDGGDEWGDGYRQRCKNPRRLSPGTSPGEFVLILIPVLIVFNQPIALHGEEHALDDVLFTMNGLVCMVI